MANRKLLVPQIGEVLLSKRRGAKHLRLSITSKGQVRVSLPVWAPYSAGISFAKSRQDWILQQLSMHSFKPIPHNARIGKSHRVAFISVEGSRIVRARVKSNLIEIKTSEAFTSPLVQEKLLTACEKALKLEAAQLLPQRLALLAERHGFSYKDVRIRKLVSRWGSCSKDGTITLSYYLMQLPWNLIDYVLLHELTHTKHMHHGADFWGPLGGILPDAKALKKQIREHKPQIRPL
jgi:predicted metal-dependent hydrolase